MDFQRLIALVTGGVEEEILLRNEYLAAENRILKAHLKSAPRFNDSVSVPKPAEASVQAYNYESSLELLLWLYLSDHLHDNVPISLLHRDRLCLRFKVVETRNRLLCFFLPLPSGVFIQQALQLQRCLLKRFGPYQYFEYAF